MADLDKKKNMLDQFYKTTSFTVKLELCVLIWEKLLFHFHVQFLGFPLWIVANRIVDSPWSITFAKGDLDMGRD
jgi:hypothetical protein